MAATPTDSTTASSGDGVPRRRGKSRATNFKYDGPVSVIRLELDVSDVRMDLRLQRHWAAVFRLRRARQRDAAARCRAYWVARHERGRDGTTLRTRLGLSRKGIDASAKAHIERSGWMRDHVTKAIGLRVADEVWETVDRHLFADCSGRRHGPPRIGSWWDFTRIPGRARSHTKAAPVWENYRLVGTLDGHLGAYRHPALPASVSTAESAAAGPAGTSVLAQPAHLATPARPVGAVGRSPRRVGGSVHRAARRGSRATGPAAPGGWPVGAPVSFSGRPQRVAQGRSGAGARPQGTRGLALLRTPVDPSGRLSIRVDGCLALASFPDAHPEQLVVEQIACTDEQQQAAARAAQRARERQRALDRSRRNTNANQYGASVRQAARAARRAERGLAPKHISNPGGARHARAQHIAARIVATHGNTITVEDTTISTWARLWGKRIALFSPGMLVGALATECAAAGGRLYRAGTRSTALSQHCPCGARVSKTLAERTHHCPGCGLRGDRDIVSATLAACVELADPDDPRTARVDYRLAHVLRAWLASQQEWEGSVNRHQPPASPDAGSARTGSHHAVASAEQAALGSPPNRPGTPGRRGTSRKQPAPSLIGAA